MDAKVKQTLLEKCVAYFKKANLPFKVSVDETKEKVDRLILFCKDKTTNPEFKFEELMLVDGVTKVTIEPAIEVGAAMAIYDAEGNPIPIPANPKPYELQDGRMVMIEQDGIIASVTEVEETELDAEGKPKAKESNEGSANQVKEMIERIETVSRYAETVKAEFEVYKIAQDAKFEALKNTFSESQKFNKEAFETLLSEPAKPAVNQVVNPFQKKETSAKSEGMFDKFLIKQ